MSRARARRDDAKRLGHSSLAAVAAAAPLDRFDLLRNGREQLHAGRKEGREEERESTAFGERIREIRGKRGVDSRIILA